MIARHRHEYIIRTVPARPWRSVRYWVACERGEDCFQIGPYKDLKVAEESRDLCRVLSSEVRP